MKSPQKRRGRRRSFPSDLEREITRRYFDDNETAKDLADEYGPLSRWKSITPTGIREIAIRVRNEDAPVADNDTGQTPTLSVKKHDTTTEGK